MATKPKKVFGPASEKQRLILQDNTTDVILIGGGAGGGKSMTCLIKNLDGINDRHFRCTILRRTYPELKRQGGLIDESKSVYEHFGAIYKTQAMRWDFPSGAQISFSAINSDDDLGGWQGSQLVRVLIDEAADRWTEKQILFLLSRLRSAHSKIHPQLIMSCNPDIKSFLKEWVDFCLDPDTGVPVEGTENRIRWFVTLNNQVYWADSAEECFELHGKPRDMVMGLGLTEAEIKKIPPDKLFLPKSFRFIPTGVYDNPYLLPPKNNSYLANLLAQPRVNQLKFLLGSWTAKEEGTGYFKREWVKFVDTPPSLTVGRVRSWDLAATEASESNRNPDWTAGVKVSRDKLGNYYVEDVIRFRKLSDGVIREIIKTANEDGLNSTTVTLPRDGGAGGKIANSFLVRTLAEQGIASKSIQMSGHSGKLQRFLPFASIAEAGCVYIVKGEWNEDFLAELEGFIPNTRNIKDDQVDAVSDAFNTLSKSLQMPNFIVPDFTRQSIKEKLQ